VSKAHQADEPADICFAGVAGVCEATELLYGRQSVDISRQTNSTGIANSLLWQCGRCQEGWSLCPPTA
jgi:hypothetical protein